MSHRASRNQNLVTKIVAGMYRIQTFTQRFEIEKMDGRWFLFTYTACQGRNEWINDYATLSDAKTAAFNFERTATAG